MARIVTAGERAAAQAAAPPVPAPATLHVGLAMETFSYPSPNGLVTHLAGARFYVTGSEKALLQATDKTIVWES